MSNPWALANKIEQDDDNVIRLTNASWADESLELQIEISSFGSERQFWQIRCQNVLENDLKNGSASSLELTAEHPLLWKFRHDCASAYFNGAPPNALAAVGSLYEAHQHAVGAWFNLEACINSDVRTSDLLSLGNGLLAQGPIPLLAVYKDALSVHGINVEILSPYSPPSRMSSLELQNRLHNETKVLLIGGSFITGIGWTAKRVEGTP
jgi:hypothetical protein